MWSVYLRYKSWKWFSVLHFLGIASAMKTWKNFCFFILCSCFMARIVNFISMDNLVANRKTEPYLNLTMIPGVTPGNYNRVGKVWRSLVGKFSTFVIQDITHVGWPAKKDFWKVVVFALGSSVLSNDRITAKSIHYYRVLCTLGNLERLFNTVLNTVLAPLPFYRSPTYYFG